MGEGEGKGKMPLDVLQETQMLGNEQAGEGRRKNRETSRWTEMEEERALVWNLA